MTACSRGDFGVPLDRHLRFRGRHDQFRFLLCSDHPCSDGGFDSTADHDEPILRGAPLYAW